MNKNHWKFYSLLLFQLNIGLFAQITPVIIPIGNGSFEGKPNCCIVPDSWENAGSEYETPPDIQPATSFDGSPLFNVNTKAKIGKTYLAMVVRENGTYERIRQRLEMNLIKDSCYKFSIYLCRSDSYQSPSRVDSRSTEDFSHPCILRIWGIGQHPEQKHFIVSTEPIITTDWQKYTFKFSVPEDIQWIELEAYYSGQSRYNGNLLLDGMSDIETIYCAESE